VHGVEIFSKYILYPYTVEFIGFNVRYEVFTAVTMKNAQYLLKARTVKPAERAVARE
jgi:hypothetical protein